MLSYRTVGARATAFIAVSGDRSVGARHCRVSFVANDLMALRNAVPIEEYLAKIALSFA